jgi:hypothetical protein
MLLTKQDGNEWDLRLEVSLDVVSFELGIYEIVLADKTGAIFVLVVGLCRRSAN